MEEKSLKVEISQEVALVLFEALSRFEASGGDSDKGNKITLEDRSEKWAFLQVLGGLEKQLVEPFKPDYIELLKTAQKSVVEKYEGDGITVS
mgnify:FL=1